MKTKHILTIAMAGFAALPVLAEDETLQTGDILQDINMFTPEDGDPAYKVKANEKYGTQWGVDVAYGYWGTNKATPGTNGKNNYALLHAQLNQRLIEDETNGGTWLRAELSGSWALDHATASHHDGEFVGGYGSVTDVHGDIYGQHNAVIPELALMHYLNGKRACIIAGMVNLTNYFDAVGIANDSFSNFANTGFMNSTVLPLVDSNAGAILQVELGRKDYVMAAVSRTTTEPGYDPFNTSGKGYCVVGEWGHIFADGKVVTRLNPFFELSQAEDEEVGTVRDHRNAGLAGSIEYTPIDSVTLFARAGFAAKQYLGNAFDFSVGGNVRLIPSREDDFLGVAYGVFKGATNNSFKPSYVCEDINADGEGCEFTGHHRQHVVEVMYSLQVTDYFKVVPHFQYIANPAYRHQSDETIFGVQTVFSF